MENERLKIIAVDIEKEMKKSYLDYSMSVIVGRALPDVRDGLKPVHRRILYTLHENGLTPDKAYRKCADTVGSVLGRYHPHGDASVYDALVRMAQDFSLRYPMVDGHGNFGSVDGDPPAAYRYTESRMSKISLNMLTDIEKNTVDFVPNYDDRLKEPVVLPARIPNLLINGSTGIAVGMATNIPPHNLAEVVEGVCYLIDNPDATLEDIMNFIKGPDFPTGGVIMGVSGIKSAYATGRGKITLRAKTNIEELKNGKFRIVVTEIPYMVNKARLIENIAELVKEKRVEGISDLRDESDRDGMRVVIELKKDANPQVVLNKLYSYTQLQDTVGVIMLALVNGEPKVMALKEVLNYYIEFQESVVTRRVEFDLKKARERAHILEGLKIALDNIDEIIAILKKSASVAEGKQAIMERFALTEIQAQAIVSMRLAQLTGLERSKIEEELKFLLGKIEEYLEILADRNKILSIIKEEITSIKDKFADDRRTSIEMVSGEVDIEDLISEEDCVITLTRFGYIKRQPVNAYKIQKRGGKGVSGMTTRDEDCAKDLFICSTHDYIMFFTNKGRVFRLKAYEIPSSSRTAKGINIVNILQLEQEEKVSSMLKVKDFNDDKYIVMVTTNGLIKKTELSAYKNIRKTGVIAILLNEDDNLAWVRLTEGDSDLIIATKKGKAIRLSECDIRSIGRNCRGVRAINLKNEDEVIGMAVVKDGDLLLTVTEKGKGRKTLVSKYTCQNRGGQGKFNYKIDKNNDYVAAIESVNEDDDIIIIRDKGVIIRIDVSEIATSSRTAVGVKVMRVAADEKVISVAKADKIQQEEQEEIDSEIEKEERFNK